MLRLFNILMIPTLACAAVQCFVGQKLFSYESNNAICARFVPYHCAALCDWRRNCSSHSSFAAFHGRRTFVSGLLINSKSLMVLCCASLATRLETDARGREKCAWRETESIAVLGPSIRTNPVLAPNHYIRDVRMARDGASRVDVTLEVCQYETEREHCNSEKMTEIEKRRFNIIAKKLQRLERIKSTVQQNSELVKISGDDKTSSSCEMIAEKDCGKEIQSQIKTCCIGNSSCDHDCLRRVERSLSERRSHEMKGCTIQENQLATECFGRKINTIIS